MSYLTKKHYTVLLAALDNHAAKMKELWVGEQLEYILENISETRSALLEQYNNSVSEPIDLKGKENLNLTELLENQFLAFAWRCQCNGEDFDCNKVMTDDIEIVRKHQLDSITQFLNKVAPNLTYTPSKTASQGDMK